VLNRRYWTKARACRDGRVIDLQITCVPCLVVLALHYGGFARAHYRLGAWRWGRSVHLDADGDGWACGWDLGLGALLEEVDEDED